MVLSRRDTGAPSLRSSRRLWSKFRRISGPKARGQRSLTSRTLSAPHWSQEPPTKGAKVGGDQIALDKD